MKNCNKCNASKALADFKNDPRNKDGKQGICTTCIRTAEQSRRENRRLNPPKTPPEKICKVCGVLKLITEYYSDSSFKDGKRPNCKVCKDKHTMAWRSANREQYNKNQRKQHAKNYVRNRLYRYDLTPEEYTAMMTAQNNKCAICGGAPKGSRPLVIDHNHETGEVRSLLCYGCNRALHILENTTLLGKSNDYLNKFRK